MGDDHIETAALTPSKKHLLMFSICCAIILMTSRVGFAAQTKEAAPPEATATYTSRVVLSQQKLVQTTPIEKAVAEDAPIQGEEVVRELTEEEMTALINPWGVNMSNEEMTALLDACWRCNVEPAMALAVVEQESQFTRDIISSDGRDYGYFQIRDSNHSWVQEETGMDPKDPIGNIVCGVWLLSFDSKLTGGNDVSTLTTYRWGHDNGNHAYAKIVLGYMEKYKEIDPPDLRLFHAFTVAKVRTEETSFIS